LLIKLLGGGGEVGRVAIYVRHRDQEAGFLFDYGIGFDNEGRPVFPGHIRPRDIQGVFLSHAHLDHCGALPSLYVSNPPKLYATPPTIELAGLMFRDAVKISGYYLPYEDEEVSNALRNATPVNYGETLELGRDSRATFLNAGHVPGSMLTLLEVNGSRVLFTGDFNLVDSNLLRGADLQSVPRDVDVVIMEGTYVSYTHPSREEMEAEFIEAIRGTLEEGGVVLIPSFTVGRAQELLVTLHRHGIGDYPVIVDGLARVANQLIAKYPNYLKDPELYVKAIESSIHVPGEYFRKSVGKGPAVIVTPAGMLKGGAAVYYLKRLGRDRRNAIVLPSYQAPDAPGYELLTRGRVTINNHELVVEAKVYWFDFSAHSGRSELEEFIRYFDPGTKIIMIHTEPIKALNFAERLRRKYGINNLYVTTRNEETLYIP